MSFTAPKHGRKARRVTETAMKFAVSVTQDFAHEDSHQHLRLVEAFATVPREEFIEQAFFPRAYQDISLPIGHGQTISKPTTVAAMLSGLNLKPGDHVLEVGSGCGYVLALLAAMGVTAYGVEKVAPLAQRTRHRLDALGMQSVVVRQGDGAKGWEEMGPFNAVIISCAFRDVPRPLFDQLVDGGRLIAPVVTFEDGEQQRLRRWRMTGSGEERRSVVEDLGPCHFVSAT